MINIKSTYKRKNIFINLIILIISTIISLVISEFFARRFLNINYRLNIKETWLENEVERGYKITDLELGFKPGPLWAEFGKFGFQNGSEYKGEKENIIDVAILGDSLMQDEFLERAFKCLFKDRPYRFWNAGIGGYNTIQEAFYLERYIKLTPKILILGFCLNDFTPSMTIISDKIAIKKRFEQNLYEPLGVANPFLFRHSALYRYLKLKSINLIRKDDVCSVKSVLDNRYMVELGFKKMLNYCIKNKASFFVIIYPHLQDYSGQLDNWLEVAHISILKLLDELGIQYIDLHNKYKSIGFKKLANDREDQVHPNYEGHFVAAKELIDKFYLQLGLRRIDKEKIANVSFAECGEYFGN